MINSIFVCLFVQILFFCCDGHLKSVQLEKVEKHHQSKFHYLTPTHKLMDDLFRNYHKEIRPVYNDSDAVDVRMHLWFKQVLKVDEIDQILTIYCWVEEYWNDEFLRWDPNDYGGVTVIHIPVDKIWRPDIMVYNNADMNIKENELTTNVVLNYTGDLVCFRAVITKITCNLDMTFFPFDQQKCNMTFASWSYDGSKVMVNPKQSMNNLVYYIENTEWKLLSFECMRSIKFYDCCLEPYPEVSYHFILERNPSYYVLNLIIPSVFITVVTMVGFFTPYSSSGENTEKVSLGVTALLSLAIILLMVADKMPATSKVVPLIGKYYIGLIWLIFAATIITTITLRLQSKGNAGKPLSPYIRKIFFDFMAKGLFMKLDLPPNSVHSFVTADGNIVLDMNSINTKTLGRISNSSEQLFTDPLQDPYPHRESSPVWKKHSDDQMCIEILRALKVLQETTKHINDRLIWHDTYTSIQQEWGQLARIVERLLMIVFVIGTIIFAVLVTVLAVPIPLGHFW